MISVRQKPTLSEWSANSSATEVYEFNLLARTAFLAEQAEIARELGLSDGVTELFVNATRNPQAIQANAEVPFYLRGQGHREKNWRCCGLVHLAMPICIRLDYLSAPSAQRSETDSRVYS